MNHHVLPPLAFVLCTGLLVPWLLVRARWAQQVPRLALAVWAVSGVLFAGSAALLPAQLILPSNAGHQLSDTLFTFSLPRADTLTRLGAQEGVAAAVALAIASVPLGAFAHALVRARRERLRHARALSLVGRYDATLRATVLDHRRPAVYCLPGRVRRVVVSSGALDTLTTPQLDAALAHERAHIAGRHHLLVAAVESFATIFPHLPLARHGRTAVPLLLEMAADDRALHRCSRDALATALYALASGKAPTEAFGAGGPSAALRMRRILAPHSNGHPILWGMLTIASAALAAAPLIIACCSFPN
ncbi:M56 family metallopeptidase [Streptomyces sp. NPDC048718]|uniref:M56 family metallopeptidase n=1 Tax=Streptomyces sp. NPDC048718 TaxID=3365587 RepID=UPI00372001E8